MEEFDVVMMVPMVTTVKATSAEDANRQARKLANGNRNMHFRHVMNEKPYPFVHTIWQKSDEEDAPSVA